MLDKKGVIVTDATIWRNLDFQKVKQRLDQITDQLERVRRKFEVSASETSHSHRENS